MEISDCQVSCGSHRLGVAIGRWGVLELGQTSRLLWQSDHIDIYLSEVTSHSRRVFLMFWNFDSY